MAGAAGFTANSLMYIIKYCQQQDMASIQILRERAFVRQPVHQAGALIRHLLMDREIVSANLKHDGGDGYVLDYSPWRVRGDPAPLPAPR